MDIDNEIQKLSDNRLLKSEKEIYEFEHAIANILNMNDVNCIKYLCLGFDDSTEQDEVMFGLVHAIESYDRVFGTDNSLFEFSKAIPDMYPRAPKWVEIFHKRILNDETSRIAYAKIISKADSSVKAIVVDVINQIAKKNPAKSETVAREFITNLK